MVEWDGVTQAAVLKAEQVTLRQRLAERARAYDWGAVLAILAEEPQLVNATRPDGESGYTVLHQAAHGGAPIEVVGALLRLGAWRTLRTAGGERAVTIAERRGHLGLVELLEPVYRRAVAEGVVAALQGHLHKVMRERAGELIERYALRLPEVAVLLELATPELWFPVPGMYGGFKVRLEEIVGEPILVVESWSRVVEGSGRVQVVSRFGGLLVGEGMV